MIEDKVRYLWAAIGLIWFAKKLVICYVWALLQLLIVKKQTFMYENKLNMVSKFKRIFDGKWKLRTQL